MALLHTPVKEDGFIAPDFCLKGVDGTTHSLETCKGPAGLLVMFICNHCPYVKVVIDRLVDDCAALQQAGIGCVAIMPNDTAAYPADSFVNMQVFARAHNFAFPYLIDETQAVAQAYGAVCTPDLFGFNAAGSLQYRGRVDSAGPNEAGPDTVRELRAAMTQIAQTGKGPAEQTPSMGCSIKWKN
ncbi:MAG: thioredoxin family protein [Alphaproteobacteria bacterium]|nr:thioredoxin family protein [Alphaproteobacteria bacterium]